jgi:hypothetical protein
MNFDDFLKIGGESSIKIWLYMKMYAYDNIVLNSS